MVQQNRIKWTREEALTKIVDVDFIDLTLSDAQGAIEEELNNKDGKNLYILFLNLLILVKIL